MGYQVNFSVHFSERELQVIRELKINVAQIAVESIITEVRRQRSIIEARDSISTESLLREMARLKAALMAKQRPQVILEVVRKPT